jgi:hypothetical protein
LAHRWRQDPKQKMPPADWAIMERVLQWNIKSFGEDYEQGQEVARASRFPAALPITVITRGLVHSQIRLERMSYAGIDVFDGEHESLQEKLAKLSSRSEHRVAKYASHLRFVIPAEAGIYPCPSSSRMRGSILTGGAST